MIVVVGWSGAALRAEQLAMIDQTVNSADYQKILKENVQQAKDPKHKSSSNKFELD